MELRSYIPEFKVELLGVWHASVKMTHIFLSQEHFDEIHNILCHFDFEQLQVHCLFNEEERMVGFVGAHKHKLEMLFVHPQFMGKGIGKHLLQFAVQELSCDKVDVNVQNTSAVAFYQRNGFIITSESEKDGMRFPYPLFQMQLIKPSAG
jgi:putative acetyltransferase